MSSSQNILDNYTIQYHTIHIHIYTIHSSQDEPQEKQLDITLSAGVEILDLSFQKSSCAAFRQVIVACEATRGSPFM